MKNRRFIYLSNLKFDGTIYRTQVIDWLELYHKHEIVFDLYQVFHIKETRNLKFILKQIKSIKNNTFLYKGFLILFPSKSFFVFLNVVVLYLHLLKYLTNNNEILIFTRGLFGREIDLLKRILPARIIFNYDARGAGGEEHKYVAKKQNDFSLNKFKTISHVYYLEYRTLLAADKIFVVSNALQKYFHDTFNLYDKKFVLYPCLADSDKFYLNLDIRNELSRALMINKQTRVFIYSGGIDMEWHLTERMFAFFSQLIKYKKDSLLICLTKNSPGLEKILGDFPELKTHVLSFAVPNNEVYRYLNAADYGILFRENTIMNNVASPTKFAEYILCGLPVLISEGIGDYSDFTIKYDLGVLIKESELKDPESFDFINFLGKVFNRSYISDIGKKNFSKDSAIDNIIEKLQS